MILRLNPHPQPPSNARNQLLPNTFGADDVGIRTYNLLLESLTRFASQPPGDVIKATRPTNGTQDQIAVVDELCARSASSDLCHIILTAPRGRGKSSALGLFLSRLTQTERDATVLTASHRDAVHEVLRFGEVGGQPPLNYLDCDALLYTEMPSLKRIVIDEAAQVPVPVLQALVGKHPMAQFIFSTTTTGYEGTGRGFTLRFVQWLRARDVAVVELKLREPIRWSLADPLEKWLDEALVLDAELPPEPCQEALESVVHRVIDRDTLVSNKPLLKHFFGLLLHAHYRTTPNDLHHLLDAPNIELHGLFAGDQLIAATMVAVEGRLPHALCDDVYWGRRRLRGHALPETLISHSLCPAAGALTFIRSVRIAVHPSLRRRGFASRLVEAIHQYYQPDMFGTLFGATPELVTFRQSLGYDVVRVGASRGTRTGEPAVIMIRPVSDFAKQLSAELRATLARDLIGQIELLEAGNEYLLNRQLKRVLLSNLPAPAPLTTDLHDAMISTYAFGPRTQESAQLALRKFVRANIQGLDNLSQVEEALIRHRILEDTSWLETQRACGLNSIPATMRALRRAVRQLVSLVAPRLIPTHKRDQI